MKVSLIVKEGIGIGFKNLIPLVGTIVLYLLTCWIPYLNVGTTIALVALPAAMSRGEAISPTEIFDPKYRKNMGNFFLLMVCYSLAVVLGFFFGIIPGIVLSYAWSIAFLLLVDKELDPLQALSESNQKTYGHKATIFLSFLVLGVLFFVLNMSPALLTGGGPVDEMGGAGSSWNCYEELLHGRIDYYFDCKSYYGESAFSLIGSLFSIVLTLLYTPISLGLNAVIYRELTSE